MADTRGRADMAGKAARVLGAKANIGAFRSLDEYGQVEFVNLLKMSSLCTLDGAEQNGEEFGDRTRNVVGAAAAWGTYAAAKMVTGGFCDGKGTSVSVYQFASLAALTALAAVLSDPVECAIDPGDRDKLGMFVSDAEGGMYSFELVGAMDLFDGDVREEIVNETAELLSEARERIGELERENSELGAAVKRLERELAERSASDEVDALRADVSRLESELEHKSADVTSLERDRVELQARVEELESSKTKQAASYVTHRIERVSGTTRLLLDSGCIAPKTPSGAVELAQKVFGNVLAFSGKAIADARSFSGSPVEMWNALVAIGTEYAPLAAEGRPPESRTFKQLTGFELSANESKMTKRNLDLMRQRTALFAKEDGTRVEITATHHLKGGGNVSERVLRVYFTWADELGKLAVVRCGGHLDTFGGKHRKGW